MVRRNDQVAFMAGAYVFPGGRVDEADQRAAAVLVSNSRSWPSRFPDLTIEAESPYRVAAARELEEEARVRVDPSGLVPLAHWVTPEIEIRRFDTRFYLARMPAGQEAAHDAGETTDLKWLSPNTAIDQATRGAIMLPPPTWTTLKRLGSSASIEELFVQTRAARIVRVQPQLLRGETETLLTLPGDPTYPPIEGWDVPEDTRFRLEDGRWRPVQV